MMLLKCCTQYASKFGKVSSGHRTGKCVFIPVPKKSNAKECSNYHTIALISQVSKVMLKILQARLQQYMNWEFPDVQPGFRKGRGIRNQVPTSIGSYKKQESSIKTSTSATLTMLKTLTVWITTNCGKFWKRWEYQITIPASCETCMQIKKQQLEPDIEQLLLLKLSRFSCVRLCATPYTAAHQAPPSLGFSRQEHRSALPFPSPMHESEKWKWSRLVVSDP